MTEFERVLDKLDRMDERERAFELRLTRELEELRGQVTAMRDSLHSGKEEFRELRERQSQLNDRVVELELAHGVGPRSKLVPVGAGVGAGGVLWMVVQKIIEVFR